MNQSLPPNSFLFALMQFSWSTTTKKFEAWSPASSGGFPFGVWLTQQGRHTELSDGCTDSPLAHSPQWFSLGLRKGAQLEQMRWQCKAQCSAELLQEQPVDSVTCEWQMQSIADWSTRSTKGWGCFLIVGPFLSDCCQQIQHCWQQMLN